MNSGNAQSTIDIRFKDDSVSWEQITELLHIAYKTNLDNGMNFAAAHQTVEQTVKRVGDGCVLLAFDGARLIGTVTCHIKKDGKRWYEKGINGHISQVAVLPECRKNGIGIMMLNRAYEYFADNGAKGVILDTSERAERLINYYKRQGFVPVDYVRWSSTNYNSIVFRKPLGMEYDAGRCAKMFSKAKRELIAKQRLRGIKAGITSAKKKASSFIVRRTINMACRKRSGEKKNILLYCNTNTMVPHLLKFYNEVKQLNCRFYLAIGPSFGDKEARLNRARQIVVGTDIIPIIGFDIYKIKWELIAIADIVLPPHYNKNDVPVLYVNHGSHMISQDGGQNTYAYSELSLSEDGSPLCTVMLEPNRRIAQIMQQDEKWKNVVKHIGCKDCEDIAAAAVGREEFRQQLGISANKTFVMCFGSWRADSLFHYVDRSFFDSAKALTDKGDYVFGLSAHPNEYRKYSDSCQPIGQYIDSMADKGFIVRKPSQDYIPYLIAADIVVTDFSTMSELAILCDKKLILSHFPKDRVWKHSMTARLREVSPILYKDAHLEQLLDKVINTDVCKAQGCFKEELYVSNGEYKDRVLKITKQLLKIGEDTNE